MLDKILLYDSKPTVQVISVAILIEEHSGFRNGHSYIDDVFNRREFNLETHMAFVGFEKAFDRADRPLLWNILDARATPKCG